MLPQATPRRHTAPVAEYPVERATARPRARAPRDDDLDALGRSRRCRRHRHGHQSGRIRRAHAAAPRARCRARSNPQGHRQGLAPRARQVGITGRSIAPRLYVSIGASGKFNHVVGIRGARTVLAINPHADALIFDSADIGIVADWHDAVPLLVAELERVAAATPAVRSRRPTFFSGRQNTSSRSSAPPTGDHRDRETLHPPGWKSSAWSSDQRPRAPCRARSRRRRGSSRTRSPRRDER